MSFESSQDRHSGRCSGFVRIQGEGTPAFGTAFASGTAGGARAARGDLARGGRGIIVVVECETPHARIGTFDRAELHVADLRDV